MIIKTTFSEVKGRPRLDAIGITNKVVSDNELDMINKYAKHHYLHWRHQFPAKNDKGIIFGICDKAEIKTFKDEKTGEDIKGIDIGFELLNLTEEHEKAIEFCKKSQELGKPVGISVGKQKFQTRDGKVVASFPFDWSITDIPHDIWTKTGVITYMEDTEQQKLEKEIETLRNDLNIATGKLEQKKNEISQLTEEYENKLKESVGEKIKILQETFEKRIRLQTEELEKKNRILEEKLMYAEKKPILDKISEFEDEYLVENFYKNQSIEELEKRLVDLEKKKVPKAAPSIESFERSRSAIRKKNRNSVLEMLEKTDPELAKLYKKGM